MGLANQYWETVRDQLDAIRETQTGAIESAGRLFSEVLQSERWIYLFGTGHSHMLAEELFYRAGGLVRIKPMLNDALMLHVSASESTAVERDLSVVADLLEQYPVARGDVLLIASNSGRNPVPVELALRAQARGVPVVGVVNRRHSAAFPSRHESGKKLGEVADVVIDNCGVVGDACVPLGPGQGTTGAASTVTGALILQMIACEAIERAMAQGWLPEIFTSSNGENEDHNADLVARYRGQVRHL